MAALCKTTECIRTYQNGEFIHPPDGVLYAPYVIAELRNGTARVSVGNESAPMSGNSAIIKSFQFGASNGTGATIEIIDEEGGHFEKFFAKVTHSVKGGLSFTLKVKWGWIVSHCNGQSGIGDESQWHHFIITKISIKFESKIKFVLECTDIIQFVYETRNPKVYGQQDQKMALQDAIRQLCKDNIIPINNVKFLRQNPNGGEPVPWKFKNDPCKGVWTADGQHVLDTLKRWLKSHLTENDKGVIPTWDSTEEEPTLILWEDPNPKPNDVTTLRSIGSYIVNGGDCSGVISFNPEIKWAFTMLATAGGFIDKTTGEVHDQKDEDGTENVGITTINQITPNAKDIYGTDAGSETIKADKVTQRANNHYSVYHGISAELRIIGDPKLDRITQIIGSAVGIAVVNPFNVASGSQGCEWLISGGTALAQSSCNVVLSNKHWIVMGVAHDIREGSYVTSLNLYLANPGQELAEGRPMGGGPDGYEFPSD